MAHTDGEDQKRHENGIGIQHIAEEPDDPKQPDDGDEGAGKNRNRAAEAMRKGKNEQRRDEGGDKEKAKNLMQGGDEIAHDRRLMRERSHHRTHVSA